MNYLQKSLNELTDLIYCTPEIIIKYIEDQKKDCIIGNPPFKTKNHGVIFRTNTETV